MIIEALGFELDPAPWMGDAACRGADHRRFFPTRGESLDQARVACSACPVRSECLDYALRWKIEFGVWGGLSERERRRVYGEERRPPRRIQAAHGTTTRYARGCRCQDCRDAHNSAHSDYQVDRKETA